MRLAFMERSSVLLDSQAIGADAEARHLDGETMITIRRTGHFDPSQVNLADVADASIVPMTTMRNEGVVELRSASNLLVSSPQATARILYGQSQIILDKAAIAAIGEGTRYIPICERQLTRQRLFARSPANPF